jgi:hypothetical protein
MLILCIDQHNLPGCEVRCVAAPLACEIDRGLPSAGRRHGRGAVAPGPTERFFAPGTLGCEARLAVRLGQQNQSSLDPPTLPVTQSVLSPWEHPTRIMAGGFVGKLAAVMGLFLMGSLLLRRTRRSPSRRTD